MKTTYQLEQKDFLTHQLYLSSQSLRIKKKRIKNKIIPPSIYTLLGVICYLKTNIIWILIGFLIFSILWLLFYPIWERKHYIHHYKSFIHENYQTRLNQIVSLDFGEEYVLIKDDLTEGKILNYSILSIIELKEHIFLQLGVGQSIILPKDQIDNIEQLTTYLKTWANDLNIEYRNEPNWNFK